MIDIQSYKILYLGPDHPGSTSKHRSDALGRLGYKVTHLNPEKFLGIHLQHHFLAKIHFRTGYLYLQDSIQQWLSSIVSSKVRYDLVWVDGGELFGPSAFTKFKQLAPLVVLFNVDDPTGPRDGNRFNMTRMAISKYDLAVTVRTESEIEMMNLGCSNVIKVWRSYDEVAHRPLPNPLDIPDHLRSDVAFIGTWMRNERRCEFLLKLIEGGIPISIWGDRWQKSPLWNRLKSCYRGPSLSGRDYVAAIQGSKICLGLLSKGNRDLHTTRSLEIPYIGGLFCAERTSEHKKLYREGVDAIFWESPYECIDICHQLLRDHEKRDRIRSSGMKRVRELKVGNEDICQKVVQFIHSLKK
jgi:spore maturation protein CgeB